MLPIVQGVAIDTDALLSLAHSCTPGGCGTRSSCCAHYEVCVEEREVSSIIGCMPAAARYSRRLRSQGGFPSVLEDVGGGLYALDTNEQGLCVFAYRNRQGAILCSLHSAALDLGLSPYQVKPQACSMWPLAMATEPRTLTVQGDALSFACNKRRRANRRHLHPGVAAIVAGVFGTDFMRELDAILEKRWNQRTGGCGETVHRRKP